MMHTRNDHRKYSIVAEFSRARTFNWASLLGVSESFEWLNEYVPQLNDLCCFYCRLIQFRRFKFVDVVAGRRCTLSLELISDKNGFSFSVVAMGHRTHTDVHSLTLASNSFIALSARMSHVWAWAWARAHKRIRFTQFYRLVLFTLSLRCHMLIASVRVQMEECFLFFAAQNTFVDYDKCKHRNSVSTRFDSIVLLAARWMHSIESLTRLSHTQTQQILHIRLELPQLTAEFFVSNITRLSISTSHVFDKRRIWLLKNTRHAKWQQQKTTKNVFRA